MCKILYFLNIKDVLQLQRKQESVVFSSACAMVGWKVPKLTKILSLNTTKWSLFFNIVILVVDKLLQGVLPCLDPMGQKVIDSI